MIRRLVRVPVVPVELLHEFAHVLAAAPWAEEWEVVVGPGDRDVSMDTFVEFDEDAPSWAVAWAHMAPMLTGLLGALVGGLALTTGAVSGPRSPYELLLWSALALAWTMYTRPSRADIDGAVTALGGDDDGR